MARSPSACLALLVCAAACAAGLAAPAQGVPAPCNASDVMTALLPDVEYALFVQRLPRSPPPANVTVATAYERLMAIAALAPVQPATAGAALLALLAAQAPDGRMPHVVYDVVASNTSTLYPPPSAWGCADTSVPPAPASALAAPPVHALIAMRIFQFWYNASSDEVSRPGVSRSTVTALQAKSDALSFLTSVWQPLDAWHQYLFTHRWHVLAGTAAGGSTPAAAVLPAALFVGSPFESAAPDSWPLNQVLTAQQKNGTNSSCLPDNVPPPEWLVASSVFPGLAPYSRQWCATACFARAGYNVSQAIEDGCTGVLAPVMDNALFGLATQSMVQIQQWLLTNSVASIPAATQARVVDTAARVASASSLALCTPLTSEALPWCFDIGWWASVPGGNATSASAAGVLMLSSLDAASDAAASQGAPSSAMGLPTSDALFAAFVQRFLPAPVVPTIPRADAYYNASRAYAGAVSLHMNLWVTDVFTRASSAAAIAPVLQLITGTSLTAACAASSALFVRSDTGAPLPATNASFSLLAAAAVTLAISPPYYPLPPPAAVTGTVSLMVIMILELVVLLVAMSICIAAGTATVLKLRNASKSSSRERMGSDASPEKWRRSSRRSMTGGGASFAADQEGGLASPRTLHTLAGARGAHADARLSLDARARASVPSAHAPQALESAHAVDGAASPASRSAVATARLGIPSATGSFLTARSAMPSVRQNNGVVNSAWSVASAIMRAPFAVLSWAWSAAPDDEPSEEEEAAPHPEMAGLDSEPRTPAM